MFRLIEKRDERSQVSRCWTESRQRELRLLSNLLGKSLQSECPEEVIACLMLHYHAYFPIPERRRPPRCNYSWAVPLTNCRDLAAFRWRSSDQQFDHLYWRLLHISPRSKPPVRTNVHTRLRSTAQTPPVRISARVGNNLQLCMFPITHNQRTAWL